MSVYATVADLAAKMQRSFSTDQGASAQIQLDEAEALLAALIPGLANAVIAGTVSPILVRKVLTDAVARVIRNPDGVTTQVVGPESATFSGLAARAELAFLPAELAMITPADEGSSVGGQLVGSIRLARPDYCGGYDGPTWTGRRC